MQYFKKLAGIACAVLALGFVACANDDDDDDTTTPGAETAVTYAVGDIVLSDGSKVAFADRSTMTAAQKEAAVAVIFYVGGSGDVLGARTLGVGIKNSTEVLKWSDFDAVGYNTNIEALVCTPNQTGNGVAATATFTGELNGSSSYASLCAAVTDEGTNDSYPAWEWVQSYAQNNNLTGSYANNWYLPSIAELSMLYRVLATVNPSLTAAGGMLLNAAAYWSSSQSADEEAHAWYLGILNGSINSDPKAGTGCRVCAIRQF